MTEEQEQALVKRYDDLKIQAEMFGMEIDVETLSLVQKRVDTRPAWLRSWQEKQTQGDREPSDYEGGKDGY